MFTYPPGKASAAADCSPALLQRWIETSVLVLRPGDIESSGQGSPRRFSERRVLQLAATKALYSLGVTPSRAAAAALVWTDRGAPGLAPGDVFANGETYLVVDDSGARLIHAPVDASLREIIETDAGWQPAAAIVLPLRRLRERVVERLGEHTPTSPVPDFLTMETKTQ